MKLLDLFAEVGFKFDSMKVAEFTHLLGELNVSSIIGAGSVVALGESIKGLLDQAGQTSTAMANLNASTGLDPARVQQFEVFSQSLGAAKGSATSFLASLNKLRFDVLYKGANPQAFNLLGLSPKTETLTLLDQINARFNDNKFIDQYANSVGMVGKSYDEVRAQLKTYLASTLGASEDQMRSLTASRDIYKSQFSILHLNNDEINTSTENTRQWILAVNGLNVELQKTAITILPGLTQALKDFTEGSGFQTFVDAMNTIGRAVGILGLAGQWTKIGLMNTQSALTQPLIGAGRLGNAVRNEISKMQTNNIIVHVHADDPHEFVKKFDTTFKKYLANADSQWSLQSI